MPPQTDQTGHSKPAQCPGCRGTVFDVFLSIPHAPVFCNVLWPTQDQALNTPCARIDLTFCSACGLIWNRSFDESLVEYAPGYENSLFCSQHFRAYAQASAQRLMDQYKLRNKVVVEIGCGSGQFLNLLSDLGAGQAIGFDPSYTPSHTDVHSDAITIIPERFSRDTAFIPTIDLVCCRHVLEHVADPLQFLLDIRAAIGPDTVLHLEVPNGQFVLSDDGLWDIIYEHCSYFTRESLTSLLNKAGFQVLDVSETYNGQFLTAEARPGQSGLISTESFSEVTELVRSFTNRSQSKLESWQQWLLGTAEKPTRPALWGAGSKGVMFLNLLGIDCQTIPHIVDINPKKHGQHIPGTGQKVLSPEDLAQTEPLCVLIMNPVYQNEIRSMLCSLGCPSPVVSVWEPDYV
jgi:hypothetical protein